MFRWIVIFVIIDTYIYSLCLADMCFTFLVTKLALSTTDGWDLFYNDFFWRGLQ